MVEIAEVVDVVEKDQSRWFSKWKLVEMSVEDESAGEVRDRWHWQLYRVVVEAAKVVDVVENKPSRRRGGKILLITCQS